MYLDTYISLTGWHQVWEKNHKRDNELDIKSFNLQWWFVYPDTFVPGQYFRINEFSRLLNCPLVWTRKSVPALFVRTSEISGLSEHGLTNHHCISLFHCRFLWRESHTAWSIGSTWTSFRNLYPCFTWHKISWRVSFFTGYCTCTIWNQ